MSAQDFEAVLDAPDGNNTYGQLQQLILHIENVSSDHFLPNVAEKFFYAFCDRTLPLHKRRWIGIALHRFVQSSKLVVDHLQTISLSKLGQIILDQAEIEETKLVAGMVIRQLLKENIPYPALWPTDLVPNNVPQFPVNESQDWTSDFQGFLDDLAAIHILHPDNDSIILYTISVYAADGFKLVNPHDAAMLVLVEADFFSIIVPATSTQAAHFVDVPLCHIDSIETRTAILHDSQGIETEHEPWELVLTLKDRPWTYLANAAERRAVHVTIMLRNSTEAQEAQSSVAEAIQKLSAKRTKVKMSSSQVLVDVTLPPNSEPKEKGAVEPTEPKQPGKLVKPSNRSRPMIRKLALTNVAASNVQDEFDVPDSPPEGPKSIPQDKRLKAADTQKSRVTATSKSVQSRRNDAAESLKTQKSAQEPFGYEKLSEVANGKGPSHSQKRTHDIFEVPPDGNPEVFKRAKRRAAKSINYEESGAFEDPSDLEGSENSGGSQESMESEYGSTESDYEKTNPSKKAKSSSANKRPSRQNWNAKSKPESTPASKRKPNTRKEGSHDEEPHVSSISKKSGSGGRLSASQKSNKTGNRIAKAKVKLSAKGSINTRLSKSLKKSQVGGKEAELSEKMSSKQDSGRNTVQSEPESFDQESVPRSNPNLCGDKSMKQAPEQAEESEPDWTSLCQSSPNHAILAPKFSGSKILGFTQSPVSKNLSDTHVLNEQRTSPMLGVSQKRQVSPGDTPITPNPKRIKFAHDAEQEAAEDPDQGDRDNATGSPVTAAPSRVPGNAESPCPVNRHPHDEPVTTATKQPTAGESLNNLVASLFASDSEEIEAVQQRSQTRRKSSPNPRPNGGAPQETKTPHSTILQFGHPAVLNLSSNSKPAPASPHAESKAISGHVSSEEVEMDLERAIHQTEKIDPFKGRHNTQRFRANPFTRRLTGDSMNDEPQPPKRTVKVTYGKQPYRDSLTVNRGNNGEERPTYRGREPSYPKHVIQREAPLHSKAATFGRSPRPMDSRADGDMDMDEDDTLIAQDDQSLVFHKGSPIYIRSSSASSHSSTSREPASEEEEDGPGDELPTEEAEEMEWQAALEPHQRAIGDALRHISRRLLRHLVDKETAVKDIAELYKRDGQQVIQKLVERHQDELQRLFEEINQQKVVMRKEFGDLAKKLAGERKKLVNKDEKSLRGGE